MDNAGACPPRYDKKRCLNHRGGQAPSLWEIETRRALLRYCIETRRALLPKEIKISNTLIYYSKNSRIMQ